MAALVVERILLPVAFLCCLLQFTQVTALPLIGFESESRNRSITEATGMFNVGITRTGETSAETKVTLNVSGNATSNKDYIMIGVPTVTFAAGQGKKELNFFTINDYDIETLETIILTIEENAAIERDPAKTTLTIYLEDDDVNITCQDAWVSENAGVANISINRIGSPQALSHNHRIGCLTKDVGSATEVTDFPVTNAVIDFTSSDQVQQMSIKIEQDDDLEANETFHVRCFTNDIGIHIQDSCKDAVVTIENDDTYAFLCPPGFNKTQIRENAGFYVVEVCREGVLAAVHIVQVCTEADEGSSPAVSKGCTPSTFNAHIISTTVNLTVKDDNIGEKELKTFKFYLKSEDKELKIRDAKEKRYKVTVQDDDQTFYLANIQPVEKEEHEGAVKVIIGRQGEISVPANVSLNLVFNATAESADCSGTSPRVVTLAANEDSKTITACTVVDDRLVEDDETFKVTISGKDGSNVKADKSEKTIKLISNDVNITCQVKAYVNEYDGFVTVKMDRTGATQLVLNTISCSTADDTAFSPSDYQTKSEKITFELDDLTKTFSVVIKNDSLAEKNDSFTITCNITNSKVVVDPSCRMPITIINDDTNIYFCPGFATSVEENAGNYTIRLCRVGVLKDTHTVKLCRSCDSVSLPHDYPSVQAQCDDIVFAAYDEVKELVIPVTNDIWGEQEYKTFNISMNTTDAGVTFNDTTSFLATIHDDDNTFYLRNVSEIHMTEGVAADNVTLIVIRNGRISAPSSVSLVLVFNATAESADCTGTSPRVVPFAGGEKSRTITACTVVDDRLIEDDETFNVTISGVSPSNVRSERSERPIRITSDDVHVTCQGGVSLQEYNTSATIRLNRTGATGLTANTVSCSTADGSAFSPADYEPQTSTTVSFAVNQTSNSIAVVIKNDNVSEWNESFTLTCTALQDPRVVVDPSCSGIQIHIINDDTSVFFCPGYPTSSNVKVGTYTARLCRFGVREVTHTVSLCRNSDSGIVRAQCDDIVFAAYDDVEEFAIQFTNDALGEKGYKLFTIAINTTDPRVILNDTTSYVVNVHGNSSIFYLTEVTELPMTEGVGSGNVNVTINRAGKTIEASNVSITLVFSATAESADCTGTSPRVIQFDANEESRTITACTVVDDRLIEDDETFNVTISAVFPHSVKPWKYQRIIKLISDDVNVTCQDGASLTERSGPAVIRLDRTGATAVTANTIFCSTADGTAVSSIDYQSKSSETVTFATSDLTQNLNVVLNDDNVPEGNKSFTVSCMTSDTNAIVDPSCSGIQIDIINDDTYVYFCPGYSVFIKESVGSYTVRLCSIGLLQGTHSVRLCRSSDSVSLPHDYPSVQAQCDDIVFAAYDEVKELVIPVTNDTWGEQEYKTFNISMNTTDPGVTFNDTTSYVVTIHDDDNTFYLTDVSEVRMTEGVGLAVVTVTIERAGRTSVASNVSLVLDFTATAESADCTGTSQRVIQFDANEDSQTITACTVVDDRLVEDDETFKVTISGEDGSNVRTGRSERTIKLISDDVNVTCHGASLQEANGPATVRLDRNGATAITANNISCSTSNDTAISPTDYQPRTSATVSFAINDLTENFNVVIEDDRIVEANESFTVSCTISDPKVVVDPSCNGIQTNIVNDDTYVYFCPGYSTAIEEDVGNYTVRLCRVGVLEDTHTVGLCRTADAVSLPRDYPSVQAQCDDIVFAAYDEVKELAIPVTNDTWGEQEYKTLNISMNTTDAGVTFNDTISYIVTIHDDDNTFHFMRKSAKVYEEHDEIVSFRIRRTGAIVMSNASIIINTLAQSPSTREDFTEVFLNQRITFFVGEIEKNVSVNIVNDKLVEDEQTFQLSLTGVDGSTVFPGHESSFVTIVSNDVLIFCRGRRGRHSIYENYGPVLMEFTREGSIQYNHTMRIRTIDGTAQSNKDYTAIDKLLTFAPNQPRINETVVIRNDNVVEADETFHLAVTSSDDRVTMICPGTDFTLLNDDTFIRCANESIVVNEDDKSVNITLKREGFLRRTSSIWFSTKDGTAVDKSDYKPRYKVNRTFAPGQVYMTLSVDLVDDEYKEDSETFSVVIGSHVSTTLTSGKNCVMITIKDNDPELLNRRLNYSLVIGIGGGLIALVVILFICYICFYFHRRRSGFKKKVRMSGSMKSYHQDITEL